jgi:hypothetical protein
MTWQSFSTIKATVKRPPKPMPDDEELDLDMILSFKL